MIVAVKIGAVPHVVAYGEKSDEYDGSITHSQQLIEIVNNMKPYVETVSLWHEIFHSVMKQSGHTDWRMDEDLMEVLSYAVVQLIRDNPQLVDYTTREL